MATIDTTTQLPPLIVKATTPTELGPPGTKSTAGSHDQADVLFTSTGMTACDDVLADDDVMFASEVTGYSRSR